MQSGDFIHRGRLRVRSVRVHIPIPGKRIRPEWKTKQHSIARVILFVAMLISTFTASQSSAAKPHVERLLKKGESS